MAANMYDPPRPSFPHQEIHISSLLIIEQGLRKAWELLRNDVVPDFDLATAHEDTITNQFWQIIQNKVLKNNLVAGFTFELFNVVREPKHPNYNGKKIDKMPDLVVYIPDRKRIVDRPSDDGLFIECKPVDKQHTVGETYCDKGLSRFIVGDYAWTMPQAMMIGYASTGYTIRPKLHDALQEKSTANSPKRIETSQYPSPCPKPGSAGKRDCEAVHVTRHKRTFTYVETNEPAPEITLRHLWLKRDGGLESIETESQGSASSPLHIE